jgi:hypothetical protein
LREEPRLGVAFIAAVLVLVATGVAVTVLPAARRVAWIAAVVLGGLIVAYIASRTTGIPLLAPDREALDAIGIASVCIELLGLLCALWLIQPIGRPPQRPFPRR